VADESRTTDAAEKHIRHYIAAFDPASNRLQVMEAKKVTVRSRVRQPAAPDDDSQNEITPQTPSSRAALTQAFGTKKSKKAVVSMAENRLLARGGDAGDDPISTAILSSIKDEGDDLEDVTASRVNKPLPQPDLTATHILEVYPPSSLVFPGPARTTLSQMPLAYWRERVAAKKDVKSRYRYVANRVERLTNLHLEEPEDETLLHKMQILRYIQLLLEIHTFVGRLAARKRIPQPEDWPAKTTSDVSLSTAFLSKLVRHFFPDGTANAHSQTLFVTTILALTLHVPPPKFRPGEDVHVLVTEPTDISLDLALPPTEVAKLYRELGCKMEALTEAELARWGWEKVGKARTVLDDYGNKVTVPKPKFAKLKFPIVFPKISAGRPMKR
jgi:DNA-directed RNA polymerase I subunit RPA49